jgi:hypothetical protein
MTDTAEPERYLRRNAAARYIVETYNVPCSPKTLANLAVRGGGPPFRKAARFPQYPKSGLDAFAQSKLGPLVRSTAEAQVWDEQTKVLAENEKPGRSIPSRGSSSAPGLNHGKSERCKPIPTVN